MAQDAPSSLDVRGPFPLGRFWRSPWGLLFLVLLVVGTSYALMRRASYVYRTSEGPIFGTFYHVKYNFSSSLDEAILEELQRVDSSLSLFNPQSTLSRINRNETDAADEMLTAVFETARKVSGATDGAFDITVAPLVNAWGFGFKTDSLPSRQHVDSLRALVGYKQVSLKNGKIKKARPDIMLDLGAIAKGFAVDRVAQMLRKRGVRDYMIEIGGEIVVSGKNAAGKKWAIGVEKPIDNADGVSDQLQAMLALSHGALATSGNYHNFYIKDGHKYAHTIDPRTGFPVEHGMLSASVYAPNCATADAYATALMVLGVEGAEKVLSVNKQLEIYLIYEEDGEQKEYRSAGWDALLQPAENR